MLFSLLAIALMFTGYLLTQPRWLFALVTRLAPGALYAVTWSEPAPENASENVSEKVSEKAIALTIDDGPSPDTTAILDVLDRYNVQATFFNISGHLTGHEAVVQRAADAGHEIANHLTADEASILLSDRDFETALLTADAALRPYSDRPLTFLRPGMGFYNAQMVQTAQRHGYQLVLGSNFPYDTHLPSSSFATRFITATVQPGDIVVLHDGKQRRGQRTAQTLEKLLPALQAKGYRVTTVSNLIESAQ